jgi:hypothetical protein
MRRAALPAHNGSGLYYRAAHRAQTCGAPPGIAAGECLASDDSIRELHQPDHARRPHRDRDQRGDRKPNRRIWPGRNRGGWPKGGSGLNPHDGLEAPGRGRAAGNASRARDRHYVAVHQLVRPVAPLGRLSIYQTALKFHWAADEYPLRGAAIARLNQPGPLAGASAPGFPAGSLAGTPVGLLAGAGAGVAAVDGSAGVAADGSAGEVASDAAGADDSAGEVAFDAAGPDGSAGALDSAGGSTGAKITVGATVMVGRTAIVTRCDSNGVHTRAPSR